MFESPASGSGGIGQFGRRSTFIWRRLANCEMVEADSVEAVGVDCVVAFALQSEDRARCHIYDCMKSSWTIRAPIAQTLLGNSPGTCNALMLISVS